MGSQRFCLRWNNHQSNLLSVFDQLLHDEAFVDVTLAVEGQFLRAHKMVLSACSPYFQALFVGHPDKHPIVILKDVPYSDMRSLLDFMYRGEVSVDQDRLTAFLKVAESLRIKGLTEVHEERDLPEIANSLLNTTLPPPPPPNLHRLPPVPQQQAIKRQQQQHLPPNANAIISSSLSGQKRKRGRPRKLSGSNPGTPNPHDMDQDDIRPNSVGNHLDQLGRGQDNQDGDAGSCSPNAHCSSPDPAHCMDNTGSSHMLNESDRSTSHSPLDTKTDTKDDILLQDESRFDGDNETDEYTLKIKEEPKPSTSGHDILPTYQSAVQTDGERYASSDGCVQSVSVSICEDVSITPAGGGMISGRFHFRSNNSPSTPATEDVVITPIPGDDDSVSLDPINFAPGIHFLSHESLATLKEEPTGGSDEIEDDSESMLPGRRDLLEYLINEDGSVVCKWCGELLPSRTHWYRHKYKFHISNPPGTSSLFKCYRCNVFFKSRKGYLGHVSTRHTRLEQKFVIERDDSKPCRRGRRTSEDFQGNPEEYEKQREKEEKLVADIIDRVKRECEAQGSTVTRKGYSRRSTVMNT